jgi:hypothetical protein
MKAIRKRTDDPTEYFGKAQDFSSRDCNTAFGLFNNGEGEAGYVDREGNPIL